MPCPFLTLLAKKTSKRCYLEKGTTILEGIPK
jgi:hypothetical protein